MHFSQLKWKPGRVVLFGALAAAIVLPASALALDNVQPDLAGERGAEQMQDIMANPSEVMPGTLNYIQGSVFLQNQQLTGKSAGTTTVKQGEVLTTRQGKAEMLLTPGVYLRLGDHSALKMVSPELTWTAVDLEKGEAIVEVDEIHPANNIQVYHGGVGTQLLKTGIYKFNARSSTVFVFKGEAAVRKPGDRWVVVKSGHEYPLNAEAGVKPQKFAPAAAEGELYAWSSLRSQYLAQANQEMASSYGAYYPAWGYAPGWYPYGWGYSYFGGPFWRPFGWGFYPSPYFGGGVFIPYRGGGHPHYHHRGSGRR